MLIYHHSHHSL